MSVEAGLAAGEPGSEFADCAGSALLLKVAVAAAVSVTCATDSKVPEDLATEDASAPETAFCVGFVGVLPLRLIDEVNGAASFVSR